MPPTPAFRLTAALLAVPPTAAFRLTAVLPYSLQPERFVLPDVIAPGHPGVNVHTAGMLDAKGKPLGIHPSLRDPRDWYDAEGDRYYYFNLIHNRRHAGP